jgi:NIPSNAP
MHNLIILPALLGSAAALSIHAADKPRETRCYELRTYFAAPGKLDALNARFRNHTMRIFEKHGMANIGYWMPVENPDHKLIYILAFPNREAARQSWKEFGSDPDWQKVVKESEANGKLVARVESVFLTATDYSPEIKPAKAGEARLLELRTYTTAPGKLENLHSRFREHTCKLFEKHGMINCGYWTPMDKDKGADNMLIYIVAHQSKEAAEASWKAFRDDPVWLAARKASEEKAGGSLTVQGGVQTVFMTPTDYSPTR